METALGSTWNRHQLKRKCRSRLDEATQDAALNFPDKVPISHFQLAPRYWDESDLELSVDGCAEERDSRGSRKAQWSEPELLLLEASLEPDDVERLRRW